MTETQQLASAMSTAMGRNSGLGGTVEGASGSTLGGVREDFSKEMTFNL